MRNSLKKNKNKTQKAIYFGSVCKLGDLTILCIKFSHSEEEESDIIYTSERGPKPF